MVAKEDIPLKREYGKCKPAVKKYKKSGYWTAIFEKGTASMARVINGKLYTILDKTEIPREKVRVTEHVKQARE